MIKLFRLIFTLVLFLFTNFSLFQGDSFAQKNDTLNIVPDSSKVKKHSPITATIMSAVIPGLGQVYNKKYWKVPIVYGGLLTAGYFLKINRGAFLGFKNDYIAEVDTNSGKVSQSNLPEPALLSYMEFYRTRMEICYIALGLLYVLNIVDATVDAHLFTFDVSDDLSLRIMPEINTFSNKNPITGLRLTLKL